MTAMHSVVPLDGLIMNRLNDLGAFARALFLGTKPSSSLSELFMYLVDLAINTTEDAKK